MSDAIIENPIINSPYDEPQLHFKFDEDGIKNEIINGRRSSSYFIPIAQPRRKGQLRFAETEWTSNRQQENELINLVRAKVGQWRKGGYMGVSNTTARLLEYWNNSERDRKLFFCQIEAVETIVYITEVASKFGDDWIKQRVTEANEAFNPDLLRFALKLATGAGKTTVMGMLIAWHTLNRLQDPKRGLFSDAFLLIAPGITIRDRLRVLLPSDPGNIYKALDLVPPDLFDQLHRAKIVIVNYHSFKRREKVSLTKAQRAAFGDELPEGFIESPGEMVRRVCKELRTKKQIIVINDEAHHCYQRKVKEAVEETLTGEEKKEAKKRDEEARIWLRGILAVKEKLGVKAVYDLSATPFFLKGSGEREGVLFPWVVSDFSLIDAIEAGIVKVPRVPVQDNSGGGESPTYRDLWSRIREDFPKKGRKTEEVKGAPILPPPLEGALRSLYDNYKKRFDAWEANIEARAKGQTPPVFIIVCQQTNISKLVYDYISGWEKILPNGDKVIVPGELELFRNNQDGRWSPRPNTILIDSAQLESGEAMSADFKRAAKDEIDRFKAEYVARFPGRDAENLKDEDILREVMNTVGKTGKLGEHVRCVVSVSMLTEGWDANTVTHILGVRAFGTQLLCEQVVGRGLRRMSYHAEEREVQTPSGPVTIQAFGPEYAEVYGVPFSFIPCSGSQGDTGPTLDVTRVRAIEDRFPCEVHFPRLTGYRYEVTSPALTANFSEETRLSISTQDLPTITTNAPIVGETETHTLESLKDRRMNEVAFKLAKLTLEKYFRQEPKGDESAHEGLLQEVEAWRFPDVLQIATEWLRTCVYCKDDTFPQLLLFTELAHNAADKIQLAIVKGTETEPLLKPILRTYDPVGTTRYVEFDTTKPTRATDSQKCHISHTVADSGWEFAVDEKLEAMPEVVRYVKNHGVGFTIPYTIDGNQRNYVPDFIAVIRDREDPEDLLKLIIEVTGEHKKDKAVKVATARNYWVPAVNNHGGFGRWAFIEVADPWDAETLIRSTIKETRSI